MQSTVNSSSDDGSSTAMTLDDTVPPHLKKRALDADVPVAKNSSSPSPTKIQATNPDCNCDIIDPQANDCNFVEENEYLKCRIDITYRAEYYFGLNHIKNKKFSGILPRINFSCEKFNY